MNKSFLEEIEIQEQIQKLIDNGYGELVEAMLTHETGCFTRKSRLNKSGACRVLGWKNKQLEDVLAECRKLLNGEEE